MNKPRMILRAALVLGASLPFMCALLCSGATNEVNRATAVSSPAAITQVSVFFGEKKALTIEEIRTAAKELLKAKGQQIDDTLHCAVNIGVLGKDPGCKVIFQDLPKGLFYVVSFNGNGDPVIEQAGAVRHGFVPLGAGPTSLPEGRKVEVNPASNGR